MLGGVVGDTVVPAAPDDVAPGAGGDADGVRVVFAAGAGIVVDGCGPGAGVPGVGGEIARGVAELAVDRPPEVVGGAGAGLAGDRGDPGQPGERFGVGEPGRQSPISASSRAARTVPGRGREVKMCASGWAASCPAIWVSRALIWADSADSAAVRAAVTPAWAARSRACSSLAGAGRPRTAMVASHAPMACSSSPAAASWLPNRARNARLIGLSRSWNSLSPAGNATARCARSWLPAATRCATRSRRARTAIRSEIVASASGISGRSRARSVRSVSASTNESNRSSLAPAAPNRDRRFFTCREVITTTVMPAASSASTSGPSPRSMATSVTLLLRSRVLIAAIPALSCTAENRSMTRPAKSTTHTA